MKTRGFEIISKEQFQKDCANRSINYEDVQIPKRATKGSAGHDFFIPFDFTLSPGASIKIPTCIKAYMKQDEFLNIHPRSSHGFKFFIRTANIVPIIDMDYYNNIENEGHIWIKLRNEGDKGLSLTKGDAFCQGVFQKYYIADTELDNQTERKGGIGSTTKKEG